MCSKTITKISPPKSILIAVLMLFGRKYIIFPAFICPHICTRHTRPAKRSVPIPKAPCSTKNPIPEARSQEIYLASSTLNIASTQTSVPHDMYPKNTCTRTSPDPKATLPCPTLTQLDLFAATTPQNDAANDGCYWHTCTLGRSRCGSCIGEYAISLRYI
jgi:hypothetical protein